MKKRKVQDGKSRRRLGTNRRLTSWDLSQGYRKYLDYYNEAAERGEEREIACSKGPSLSTSMKDLIVAKLFQRQRINYPFQK